MGKLLALATALLWALGVVLYKKSVSFVTPLALSVFKSLVAFILLSATAIGLGQLQAVPFSYADLFLFLTSGAIGIGVSDTLYFMTLSAVVSSVS